MSSYSGESELDAKISEYIDFCNKLNVTHDVIGKLIKVQKFDELKQILMRRLTFGTAGLRGKMGSGYYAMNDLVVVQTSQGLAAYLDSLTPEDGAKKQVVIGFDNRHNSKRFSELAAMSFLLKGFSVLLYSIMTPTPLIPYTVRKCQCMAGIMITASHNPKDDNGYKVYWTNGAQIKPPHDVNIQDSILKNLDPWPNCSDTTIVSTSPLCSDPMFMVPHLYFDDIQSNCSMDASSVPSLKITFTSLHGVAHSFMKRAFQVANFSNFIPVKEQMYPDPDFPTVVFPNPEEPQCLDLSIKTADANGSRLIFANDPDGDRLAVSEKLANGTWHVYSGNEIGALLGSWLWETLSSKLKNKPGNCCMVSSAVSSKILRSISKVEGFIFHETLTGFKWMANKAHQEMKDGKNFVFAFEEAIGYMCGSMVLDKDGITAGMHVANMAVSAYKNGKILNDVLKDIYLKYGYHVNSNSYFICHDTKKIKEMFARLRNFNGKANSYPDVLMADVPHRVVHVRDLTTGYDSSQPDKKAILPTSSSTEMITFYFENGCEATLRTSGTEPKVKYYTEIVSKVPESEWKNVNSLLKSMVQLIIAQWMEPEKNGFIPRQEKS